MNDLGVVCGICGGTVYMHTCDEDTKSGHEWVIWSECQQCGATHRTSGCPDCAGGSPPPTEEPYCCRVLRENPPSKEGE